MTIKLDHAIAFATRALEGRVDASGLPEVLHSLAVLVAMPPDSTDEERQAAVLHDVVEDTRWRLTDIEVIFGKRVCDLVDGVTRRFSETYNAFIHRADGDYGCRKIKLADLGVNLARVHPDKKKGERLRKRYLKAQRQLRGL